MRSAHIGLAAWRNARGRPAANTGHQWSGNCRRSVLEKGEFEWRADKMAIGVGEGQSGLWRSRRNGDSVARRVFTTTRGQQCHDTFVGRTTRLMDKLVELWRNSQHQSKKKRSDKSARRNGAYCDQI